MKTNIIIILFVLTALIPASAQKKMDEPYVIWDRTRPVISIVNLRTGEAIASPELKENPIFPPRYNKEQNAVFVMTKHFGYQLDATTGKTLIEFQFTDILQKKATDYVDPNLMLMPVGLYDNGIGFFYNLNEAVQNRIKGKPANVTLKRFDILNKTVDEFYVYNTDEYKMSGTDRYEDTFLIRQHVYQKGNSSFLIDKISIDKFSVIESLNIPLSLFDDKSGLSIDLNKTNIVSYLTINDNIITLLAYEENSESSLPKQKSYIYNLKDSKLISINNTDSKRVNTLLLPTDCGIDCKKNTLRK